MYVICIHPNMPIEVTPGTESVLEIKNPYPYSNVFRMI